MTRFVANVAAPTVLFLCRKESITILSRKFMNIKTYIFIILISISFSSCSLKAFYDKDNILVEKLSLIEPDAIDSIYGAEYYDAIMRLLRPGSETKYKLITKLTYGKAVAVLQPNSDVIRERIVLKTEYILKDKMTDKEITSGHFTRSLSYSSSFAPYPNTVKDDDTHIILARGAAEEIRNRLMLYFASQR